MTFKITEVLEIGRGKKHLGRNSQQMTQSDSGWPSANRTSMQSGGQRASKYGQPLLTSQVISHTTTIEETLKTHLNCRLAPARV